MTTIAPYALIIVNNYFFFRIEFNCFAWANTNTFSTGYASLCIKNWAGFFSLMSYFDIACEKRSYEYTEKTSVLLLIYPFVV